MIAIIPARGGSKGLNKKNIRELGGKPLIHWTIKAAIEAKGIERVILSTDDAEIAELCKTTGVEIPFMRPDSLAQDDSLAIDNYIYTMEKMINEFHYKKDEFIVLLASFIKIKLIQ
jgi:N-acylneuraminate cytidylyltransferase/CMP-N,N'-diacetyllegionaminic acid synthase